MALNDGIALSRRCRGRDGRGTPARRAQQEGTPRPGGTPARRAQQEGAPRQAGAGRGTPRQAGTESGTPAQAGANGGTTHQGGRRRAVHPTRRAQKGGAPRQVRRLFSWEGKPASVPWS
ncbi:MAG TPA: hypothetical protein VL738_44610, partial [Dactylosporangium sp.]|nr:hypothetical protein [Dactylosporangium sp.]